MTPADTAPRKALLLGADGFIGRHIAFALRDSGIDVTCVARNPAALKAMGFETIAVDLTLKLFQTEGFWQPHLEGVDYVINAAGLLTGSADAFEAVHITAPRAVYAAMPPGAKGVLLSAVGLEANTKFSKYRRAGEKTAHAANITVVRAGLVVADTAYGGSSLIRALAAFPLAIPVPAGPAPKFNPIHATDLATLLAEILQNPPPQNPASTPIEIGGPETLDLREMLARYRRWLGLSKPRFLPVPAPLMSLLGRIGDAFKLGPISTTALKQMKSGVLADTTAMNANLKTKPASLRQILNARPAGTGDLWHARLYLLKPLIRLTLAFLWLASGLLLAPESFLPLLPQSPLPEQTLVLLARLGGLIDLAIALALLRNWHPTRLALIQLATVLGYTAAFTLLAPFLWLLPLGGLLKNIPVLALLLIHLTLIRER